MRASLTARGDAEALLAEASQARRAAASDAEAMVAEAEALAEQLVAEAKEVSARASGEARERSEGILSRARQEAAEITSAAKAELEELHRTVDEERLRLRAEVRAELEATRDRSLALADDIETRVGSLRPTFQRALDSIGELVSVAEKLREEANSIELSETPAPSVPVAAAASASTQAPPETWAAQQADTVHVVEVVEDEHVEEPADAVAALVDLEAHEAHEGLEDDGVGDHEHGRRAGDRVPAVAQTQHGALEATEENSNAGTRPLGWLFRAAQS
ncbi:hypothetical protein [Nocardioides sp.]|uniref:hypothetical protein n=1 Tax=Nocardioides sp. TaxID=35761 RepID=UPI003568B802